MKIRNYGKYTWVIASVITVAAAVLLISSSGIVEAAEKEKTIN